MIGQTLDHYKILAQLGEGGMGVVYRARDEVLNRDVALKLLLHGAVDKVSPDHLLREAQTASSLSHPNICTIHQVGQTGEDFYVVMELIEGRSLSDLITTTGLSMETVARYGTQIADALAHAHDRGIVHRDLKGSNVMVTPDMVRTGGVVIDVGINRTEDGLVGDVDPGAADPPSGPEPAPEPEGAPPPDQGAEPPPDDQAPR